MTPPKDPQAELLEALKKLVVGIQVSTHYADHDDTILDNQAELHIKDLLKLFQAREQQLLTKLLGELPEKSNAPASDSSYTSGEIIGWNDAIDQVVSVIKSKIGELNG